MTRAHLLVGCSITPQRLRVLPSGVVSATRGTATKLAVVAAPCGCSSPRCSWNARTFRLCLRLKLCAELCHHDLPSCIASVKKNVSPRYSYSTKFLKLCLHVCMRKTLILCSLTYFYDNSPLFTCPQFIHYGQEADHEMLGTPHYFGDFNLAILHFGDF